MASQPMWQKLHDKTARITDLVKNGMNCNKTPSIVLKFPHMWRNFQFTHDCHTWKAEISILDNFFSTNIIRDIRDKYQVWPDDGWSVWGKKSLNIFTNLSMVCTIWRDNEKWKILWFLSFYEFTLQTLVRHLIWIICENWPNWSNLRLYMRISALRRLKKHKIPP